MRNAMNCRLGASVVVVAILGTVAAWAAEPFVPFTTMAAERKVILQKIPCAWKSEPSQDEQGRKAYSFGCHGGTWGTASLYLDAPAERSDVIARVRVLWREWDANARPIDERTWAEALVKHALTQFVPAEISTSVFDAFWGQNDKSWKRGDVEVLYNFSRSSTEQYFLHKLEIVGRASALNLPVAPAINPQPRLPTIQMVPARPQNMQPSGLQISQSIEWQSPAPKPEWPVNEWKDTPPVERTPVQVPIEKPNVNTAPNNNPAVPMPAVQGSPVPSVQKPSPALPLQPVERGAVPVFVSPSIPAPQPLQQKPRFEMPVRDMGSPVPALPTKPVLPAPSVPEKVAPQAVSPSIPTFSAPVVTPPVPDKKPVPVAPVPAVKREPGLPKRAIPAPLEWKPLDAAPPEPEQNVSPQPIAPITPADEPQKKDNMYNPAPVAPKPEEPVKYEDDKQVL